MFAPLILMQAQLTAMAHDPTQPMPKLIITRVEQVDNLDKEFLGRDRADFYAVVTVDGVEFKTKVMAKDAGRPEWIIPLMPYKRFQNVCVRIMEDDGGLERRDDHVDINPMPGKKDLDLRVDTYYGKVLGDLKAEARKPLMVAGEGDSDRAKLTFWVEI